MNTRLIVRYCVRETMGLVVMGVALFWAAGRLDWWPGWAVLLLTLAWTAGVAVVILKRDPALLAERLGPRKGSKSWDTLLLSLLALVQLAKLVIAGLDERYGWSGAFAMWAQIA